MKYYVDSKLLVSDDSAWMKRLDCPLNKKWSELQPLDSVDPQFSEPIDLKRYCASCGKHVVNVSDFDDRQVGVLLQVDPHLCVYATQRSRHITFEGLAPSGREHMETYSCMENTRDVPVVRTARTVRAINDAAAEGYWPLLKDVTASDKISQKILVTQHKDGKISTDGDFRAAPGAKTYWYNPYKSPLPFAAYLVPPNLMAGSRVYIADLIEDIPGVGWNQGDCYRRKSAYAVWNGADFEIEEEEFVSFVG